MNILIEAAQVLEKAAAVIEERGWTQGTNQDNNGRLCVFGGLAVALGDDPDDNYDKPWAGPKATGLRRAIVGGMLEELGRRVDADTNLEAAGELSTSWNDRSGQTSHKVTTTMRSAAQRLYKKGTP